MTYATIVALLLLSQQAETAVKHGPSSVSTSSSAWRQGFVAPVLDACRLIEKNYVQPSKGRPALAAGIRGVFEHTDKPLDPAIQEGLLRIDGLDDAGLRALVAKVAARLALREGLAVDAALQACLAKMTASLDAYSLYIPPAEYRQMKAKSDGEFAGIGVKVKRDPIRKTMVVITALPDSPALKAGVRAGDRIVQIDGRQTDAMDERDVERCFEGGRGEAIRLTIQRDGAPGPLQFTIERQLVRVESVVGYRRLADNSWSYLLDRQGRIAYVRITSFASHTADDLRNILRGLQKQGVTALVLDLRFNGGGLVRSAVDVADLFLDAGDIVTIRYRNSPKDDEYKSSRFGTFRDLQLAVLINRESASGSEIVAAAIADDHRGVIVGERSFGKGSVQNIYEMQAGASALKLTTGSFFRPNGKGLNRFPDSKPSDDWGVRPDPGFEIKLSDRDFAELRRTIEQREIIRPPGESPEHSSFRDRQLEKAAEHLRQRLHARRKAG